MSPLGMLSPSLSEDTAWLSSSGGGTPDHFSRPYHQHPQQQVLTDAATDLMMRQQQQQQQFNPRDDDAPDDDPKDSRDCLGRVGDGDLCVKGDFGNTDSSASIMSMLMMNHPRPLLSSPVTEKHQNPNYNHSDQQLSQQNQQHFTQRSLGSHSSSLGQDNAYNTLIRGIETCRGRAVNSHHLHQRSESDSGDLTVFAQSGILPFGIETQPSEQQIYPAAEGKNLQGCRQYNKQKSQCRQPQQYQLQENGGNGGPGQRRKNQRRFSTSRQNNNFHHNLQQFQQYQEHPIGAAVSTIQEQCNRTAPSKIAQQSSVSQASAVAAIVNAKQTLFQAPFRRRCISSGGLDPEPIAPIVPPSVCSALRRRHARRMSCDGRLETYLTSLLVPQPPNSVSPGAVAATVKVPVSSQSNSHRFQQQNHQFSQQCQSSMQSLGNDTRVQSRGRGRTQASINDAQYRSKRNSLTISTDFPKDSLRDTSMSSVSDAGSDRRASISSSISDISISLSHSTTLSSSSSSTCLSSSSSNNGACMRKGGPPVHVSLTWYCF
ncbi:hypothetical protein EC991_001612 [Linnemannia zychae]|nr:hypothetical protein EC991_001612 [Linnemannia zychae]